jgi:hypothetical protein
LRRHRKSIEVDGVELTVEILDSWSTARCIPRRRCGRRASCLSTACAAARASTRVRRSTTSSNYAKLRSLACSLVTGVTRTPL